MATRTEFAASIKAKYPQYAQVEDSVLVDKMLEKYPQYRETVTDDSPAYTPPLSPEQQTENVKKAQRDAFDAQPKMDQFLAGVGKFAYSFPGMGKLSELAGYGKAANKQAELETYDTATEGVGIEDAGELLPDILATMAGGGIVTKGLKLVNLATTAAKKAAAFGAAQGGASALMHQAQNVGSGRGLNATEAGLEVGLSTLAGAGGAKLAEKLKKIAPQILRTATKPVLNSMDVPNPPNFEKALDKNLVPTFGGLEGAERRATAEVGRIGSLRDLAASGATKKANITGSKGAFNEVVEELADEFNSPKGRMTKDVYADAKKAVNYWSKQMEARPTFSRGSKAAGVIKGYGEMSVEDAMHMRQAIDREIQFRETNSTLTDGFNKASKVIRTKMNDFIKRASPETGKLTDEMAEVLPFQKALARRNLQAGNNYKVGLLDLAALTSGGTLGLASEDPKLAVPALALSALAGRKLTSTPGGAAILYNAGRSLAKSSPTRNTLAQLARSTYAKGND